MTNLKKTSLTFVALLLSVFFLAACGDDSEEPVAEETPVESEDTAELEEVLDSTLRAAATAEEGYFVENLTYTDSVPELLEFGFESPPDVTVVVVSADEETYCLDATHEALPDVVHSYDSADTEISDEAC